MWRVRVDVWSLPPPPHPPPPAVRDDWTHCHSHDDHSCRCTARLSQQHSNQLQMETVRVQFKAIDYSRARPQKKNDATCVICCFLLYREWMCARVCVYVDALGKSRCYKGLVSLESESGTCVCVCACKEKRSTSSELTFPCRFVSSTADAIRNVADSRSRSKWEELESSAGRLFHFNWKFVGSWNVSSLLLSLLLF